MIVTVGSTGADYTSLAAAEAGEQRDLVALGEPCEFECAAFADSTSVTFGGWTSNSTYPIIVRAAAGAEAGMPWRSSGAYTLSGPSAGNAVAVVDTGSYVIFERLQFHLVAYSFGFQHYAISGTAFFEVRGCSFRYTGHASNNGQHYALASFQLGFRVRNSFVVGFDGTGGGTARGAVTGGAFTGPRHIESCTFIGNLNNVPASDFENPVTVRNTLVDTRGLSGAVAFAGAVESASSNNASNLSGVQGTDSRASQTFTFVDAAGGDYNLDALDPGAKGYGLDLSAEFTTDFAGSTRTTPWDIGASEVPTGVFSDTFTRADGSLGGAWENVTGAASLVIVSGAVRGAASDQNCLVGLRSSVVPFSADQEAQVTYSTPGLGDFGGPAVRLNAATGSGYFVEADGYSENTRGVYRLSGGVRTRISTLPIVPVAGDTVRLRVVGSTLTVFVNGVEGESVVDATLSTGQPGMYYWRGNIGATMLDNFSASEVGGEEEPGPVEVTPAAAATTWTAPAPTVAVSAIARTPGSVALVWAVPAATYALSATTVTPASATVALTVPASTQAVSALTVTPAAALATWAVPAVTYALSAATAAPSPATMAWTVPTTSTESGTSVSVAAASVAWSVPASTYSLSAAQANPDAVLASWVAPTPTIVLGATSRNAAAAESVWSVPEAGAVPGNMTREPEAAALAWVVPGLTYVTSAVTRAPASSLWSWAVPTATAQNGPVAVTLLGSFRHISVPVTLTAILPDVTFVAVTTDVTFKPVQPDTTLSPVS